MAKFSAWRTRLKRDLQYRRAFMYVVASVLVAFLLGAWLGLKVLGPVQSVALHLGDHQVPPEEFEAQAQQLAARNLELSVEREANAQMQQMFAEQVKKQQELQRELALYRSILTPNDNAEGVAIHGLEMTPTASADEYLFKLILTQQQKRKQAIQGRAEITLIGLQDGNHVELSLNKLVDAKLEFNFRYFQVIDTQVTVPAGFNLQKVKVKVIVPASRWTKNSQTEQTYSVPELLQVEKEPPVILEQNTQVTDNLPQKTDVRGSND